MRKKNGEKIGILKGKSEGKAEEKREIVKNMINEKIPIELMEKVTGLSIEEIKNIEATSEKNRTIECQYGLEILAIICMTESIIEPSEYNSLGLCALLFSISSIKSLIRLR